MSGHHPPAPEVFMEIEQILLLVERIGLPAVIIAVMCYYVMQTQKSHREEIIRWEEKDTLGDSRLIDVIKEQNKQNATTAQALNDLNISNKDVTKSNERLASEIKGMAEALLSRRR
tara:strand:- start:370 stop:717 length:348 start_codon:yes stop_codon:yes gene_type:complete